MTVATEACGPTALRWTGVETSFAAGFAAAHAADVEVYYLGDAVGSVRTRLTLGTHYAMALADGSGLATMTPIALPAAPGGLSLIRNTPAVQETDFANLAKFAPLVHTQLHDASAMRDAEIRRDLTNAIAGDISTAITAARIANDSTVPGASVADALNSLQTQTIVPTTISIADSPYAALLTDTIIFVDSSGGPVVINLLAAAARLERPLSVKDITGNAATAGHNITIVPHGAETIEGLNPLTINANYGGYRLYPATAKYVIAP